MSTADLERAYASTRFVLANVTADDLSTPTPCQSWQVRDLINHMVAVCIQSTEAANTGLGPVPEEEDFTGGDILAVYDDRMARALEAFGQPGVLEKTITLPFGELPGAAYLGIITNDAFAHGWDLARSTGQSTDLDPELAARLLEIARGFIQPAFRGDDGVMPFGLEQPAPANATNADALAAFLGRKA